MFSIINRHYPIRDILFYLGEGALVFFPLLYVNWLIKGSAIVGLELHKCIVQALLVAGTFKLCLYFFDLYDLRQNIPLATIANRITKAFICSCVILAGCCYILPSVTNSSKIFWSSFFIIYLLVLFWRTVYQYILQRRLFVQEIAIVGTGKLASEIIRVLEKRNDAQYKVSAFIGDVQPQLNPDNIPVYRNLECIDNLLLTNKIEMVIVALDDKRGGTPVQELLNYKLKGVSIKRGIDFYEKLTAKVLVEEIDPSWIFFSNGFSICKIQIFAKRIFDILLSLILLFLTWPIMLLSAFIIRMESPGPIFYYQNRVGKGGEIFKVIKFRSMEQDAEHKGAVWASVDDSRVTRYGKFIRKTRIDELPQLFNVLYGKMSLIGPRPERPIFVEKLKEKIPYYDIRHDVRPGITGWAQVCYPYGASEEDALRKLEFDLYYMKNMSAHLDALIVFMTVKVVLFARGGR